MFILYRMNVILAYSADKLRTNCSHMAFLFQTSFIIK